jgi:hypothetical protein
MLLPGAMRASTASRACAASAASVTSKPLLPQRGGCALYLALVLPLK